MLFFFIFGVRLVIILFLCYIYIMFYIYCILKIFIFIPKFQHQQIKLWHTDINFFYLLSNVYRICFIRIFYELQFFFITKLHYTTYFLGNLILLLSKKIKKWYWYVTQYQTPYQRMEKHPKRQNLKLPKTLGEILGKDCDLIKLMEFFKMMKFSDKIQTINQIMQLTMHIISGMNERFKLTTTDLEGRSITSYA